MKAALITGVTGQDGSYLAELLLSKQYTVYGLARYCSEKKTARLVNVISNPEFNLIEGDLTDTSRMRSIIDSLNSTYDCVEVYNLGAQSHVKISFDQPEFTANVDALGTLRILEAIRQTRSASKFKFYQAGTSEMFGKIQEPLQNENTPFYPRSPYGVSKLCAYWFTRNYREAYGMFACTGILFNHESERRGEDFVTRKITKGLAEWTRTHKPIELGNLDSKRDWGHAKDYVRAMWLMLQQDTPDDYVIGTGETHSIREFVEVAVSTIGIAGHWEGTGTDEQFISSNGQVIVKVNPEFYRPAEVDVLIADPRKAYQELNWIAELKFKDLVSAMIVHDML